MVRGIVIPCFNEASRLKPQIFSDFVHANPSYCLCFVDDGSRDDTFDILTGIKTSCPERIFVVRHEINQGKAEAVRTGINFLTPEKLTGAVGFMDADLSTGFREIVNLFEAVEQSSENEIMAFGYRKLKRYRESDRSYFRMIVSIILRVVIRLVLRLPVLDTQCGAKVFSKGLPEHLFKDKFLTRWMFDVEIFFRMKYYYGSANVMRHLSKVEIKKWKAVKGTKFIIIDVVRIPYELIRIAVSYIFRKGSGTRSAAMDAG